MDCYINLVIKFESAKGRLRKWCQSVPERNTNGVFACRTRPLTQSGTASLESTIWIVGCLVVILGLIKVAHSEQPLFG